MTFIRITSLYGLYFFACMFVVVILLRSWSDGFQMLFALVVPGLLVWFGERRRSAKKNAKSIGSMRLPKEISSEGSHSSTHGAIAKNAGWLKPKGPTEWVPKGEVVNVGGRSLIGMIYVGTPPQLSSVGYNKCRAYIDPSLSVARVGADKEGKALPYWPGYSDIPAVCRATYLDWLAGGSSDASYDAGYMFLYFYGLERRFLVDRPSNDEKREILNEVYRLQDLYGSNGSGRRYLGSFIEVAKLDLNEKALQEPIFENSGWEIPLSLKVALGTSIVTGEPLSSQWVLSWLMCYPERILRTPATRCPDEFKALFKLRFDEQFPGGLKVQAPKKILSESYRAASSEFNVEISPTWNGQPIPDISNLKKPINIAQKIADQVMDELDKFSRFIGRKPDGRGALEAHALLPADLRQLFPSAELEKLRAWARSRVDAGGLTPVTDVIARLEEGENGKISRRQLRDAADVLARVGFGMAPDPRFALRAPKAEEPVVIFELGAEVEQLEEVSPRFLESLMELTIGTFVAYADGHVAEAEHSALRNRIVNTKELSAQEHKRLLANLDWLIAVPPNMSLLRQKLKDIGLEQQASIRAVVIAIAHADSVIQSDEVAGIEKIYKALGIDPSTAYSDLHAGRILDGPITMRDAEPGIPGESIPREPTVVASRLDPERIAAIRSDTKRVSSVLGDIFSVDEPEETGEEAPHALSTALTGLGAKHAGLVLEIVERQHWSEEEFSELSRKHGFMPSGALETLNEWAFERYKEALLDEYDGYDVSPEITTALKKEVGA
ncbi:MAG: TerB N-terminal domain-containing protein [Pseudomonadota bacterium]